MGGVYPCDEAIVRSVDRCKPDRTVLSPTLYHRCCTTRRGWRRRCSSASRAPTSGEPLPYPTDSSSTRACCVLMYNVAMMAPSHLPTHYPQTQLIHLHRPPNTCNQVRGEAGAAGLHLPPHRLPQAPRPQFLLPRAAVRLFLPSCWCCCMAIRLLCRRVAHPFRPNHKMDRYLNSHQQQVTLILAYLIQVRALVAWVVGMEAGYSVTIASTNAHISPPSHPPI